MVIKILNLGMRRGPSHEARALYDDMSSSTFKSIGVKKSRLFVAQREIGSGRPTKIQRRAIDKLMAKDDQWQ
jgi:ribosome-associated heat shock protein Hsp15